MQRCVKSENRLQNMKFNHAVSPIENPTKITVSTKKTVARLLTEINARSSAATKAE